MMNLFAGRKLLIVRTVYTPDMVSDGDIDYSRASVKIEEHPGLSAKETADIIEGEGLTFPDGFVPWAELPDGSYTSNYLTGEETEVSAHLDGYPERIENAVRRKVGR